MESPTLESREAPAVTPVPPDSAGLSRLRRLARETMWVVIGQALTMAGGFLGVKVLARTLDKHEFGIVALGTTGVSLANLLLFGPLSQGFLRQWSACRSTGSLPVLYRLAERWGLRAVGATAVLGILGAATALVWATPRWSVVVLLSCLAAVGTGWVSLPQSLLNAARRQRDVAWIGGGAAVARAAAAGACVLLIDRRAEWALVGQAVAAAGMVWLAARAFRRLREDDAQQAPVATVGPGPDTLARELLGYSWPFVAWGVFGWAQVGGDRWILEGFEGTASVAGYAVISQLASFPLIFLTGLLGMLGAPIAFARRASGEGAAAGRRARRAVWMLVGAYALGATGVLGIYWLTHRWLVLLVSDPRYASVSGLLPALTAGWTLYYLGQMLAQFGLLEGRSAAYIAPKVGSSLILIAAGVALCPRLGTAGLVWAVGLSGGTYAVWCGVIAWLVGRPPRASAAEASP